MGEFIPSPAGECILQLVARGNAIIAELLRLSQHIPAVFADGGAGSKYGAVIFSFEYLQRIEYYEEGIMRSAAALEADEEFRDNHLELLTRFYKTFESMYVYRQDFLGYLDDLARGVFIQRTLESVLADADGKQLVSEAVYLYGVMLLLLDMRIPGLIRERMLISFYRYQKASDIANIDEVCKLCASTGFTPGNKKPKDYPESLFARFPLPRKVVGMVLGRLRMDDIYEQVANYPDPEHRSVALAGQASMIYVILYFAPNILHSEPAVMREIVDKHFPDNWVIPYYMGFTVDLSLRWQPYRAARDALANTIKVAHVRSLVASQVSKVPQLLADTKALLTEGVLEEEYVMKEIRGILNLLREGNATLRWMALHSTTANKKLASAVNKSVTRQLVLRLLLDIAELEFKVKDVVEVLLTKKQERWVVARQEAVHRMTELAEYFSGTQALTRVEANAHLQSWFVDISDKIAGLSFVDPTLAGRKIKQLIVALEEVESLHHIDASLHVKEFLGDTRKYLQQMLYYVNIQNKVLVTLAVVTDLSYAWHILASYIDLMQAAIRANPGTIVKLRSTFRKLASLLDLPCIRIQQADSPDLGSVSQYYSSDLVRFIRRVLEIIPVTMFEQLNKIIVLQTSALAPLPARVEKAMLKEFAQLDVRYELARLTHSISVFTEGVLAMKKTLVGVIEVNPKALLEEGIRKELVAALCKALDTHLVFSSKKPELLPALQALQARLAGFRLSFEYVQDYVGIYGLKLWQEEFSRIVNFCVEQECNTFLKKKLFWWDSKYYNEAVPIVSFPARDAASINGIGRLTRTLLALTSPTTNVYVEKAAAWFVLKSGEEGVNLVTAAHMLTSLSVFGLRGVDKLLGFMNVAALQRFVRSYARSLSSDVGRYLASVEDVLLPLTSYPATDAKTLTKFYGGLVQKLKAWWPLFLETVIGVGQRQLLRRLLGIELAYTARVDSPALSSTLDALNMSLLKDIEAHYRDPEVHPYPKVSNPLLATLAEYLDSAGKSDPLAVIYVTSPPLGSMALLVFLFVLSVLPQLTYDPRLDTFVNSSKKVALDGAPFVVGVVTLLKQFHASVTTTFLKYMGQYIRASMAEALLGRRGKGARVYSPEVRSALLFLHQFCTYGGAKRKDVEQFVPAYVVDRLG
ncbi:WASH complex subunit strumpellin [Thecamonas trahens ATCC 50062]|uniref:WASH complex subunit strumpellin n=1 Tax=Thecamonas trahens ATCC 50062 TaxID=461836 RepID=A0A0L0D764_THETB|nr:WASH complex subunit strumpellin [Thecamonas trahens ATCC 50062]KNC47128.1 WASH complex subunit strumpellin [Thecamonas trahens ATCC 50062]|eukprot:XP_013759904.1 WASH complex subunit strumpellin [Thecamonas trahens ATCC 50062]